MLRCIVTVVLVLALGRSTAAAFDHFITAVGDKLMDGQKEFRFVSFNIPCLHYNEDNLPFAETVPWRFPDEFEINDALLSLRQLGGTATRINALTVRRPEDHASVPRHVNGPGNFCEQAFQALDRVLAIANKTGVRVIIPLVNNGQSRGGVEQYAGFRGKPREAFWTDAEIFADFQKTIQAIVQRTNTLTGIRYCDDRGLLAWQTGNELDAPPEWTSKTAAYIKSLDLNHLVIDGCQATVLQDDSIDHPQIDIVMTYHCLDGEGPYHQVIAANREGVRGKKPYVVGVSGLVTADQIGMLLDTVIQQGVSGCLLPSLSYRNRDGGFYWHSERLGDKQFNAYHWSGYYSEDVDEETSFLAIVQRKAFEIRGLSVPELTSPEPPHLLSIADQGAISWQGSVGAARYSVDRGWSPDGPWFAAGMNVREDAVAYRPLFADTRNALRRKYYYRVAAANDAGISSPSNVVGPVDVQDRVLVDPLQDLSLIYAGGAGIRIRTDNSRWFKEDRHRLAGQPGAWFTYAVDGDLQKFRVDTFFENEDTMAELQFALSRDGKQYRDIEVTRTKFPQQVGDDGFWLPVRYEANVAEPARQLRIRFSGDAQVSHVVLRYDFDD